MSGGGSPNVYGVYKDKRDDDGLEGKNKVHSGGVPLIGSSTLCGHTDTSGTIKWHATKRPVNCNGCLAIIDHVKRNHCDSARIFEREWT